MILFFVGVIELVIATFWTRVVAKSNVAAVGVVTTVNIFIWYYVLRTVLADLNDWTKIVPYVAGCAVGAMLGAVDHDKVIKRWRKALAKAFKTASTQQVEADDIVVSPQIFS